MIDAVGGNEHPERTLKAEVLAEWEAISRLAKRRWAEERGHDCISLQHDGIALALAAGCTVADVTLHLRDASARALGYPMAVVHEPMHDDRLGPPPELESNRGWTHPGGGRAGGGASSTCSTTRTLGLLMLSSPPEFSTTTTCSAHHGRTSAHGAGVGS